MFISCIHFFINCFQEGKLQMEGLFFKNLRRCFGVFIAVNLRELDK